MRWLSGGDLEEWARRIEARTLFSEMVADLIRASVSDLNYFRFPGGDLGQIRGFDGDLEVTKEHFNVPEGRSKWEFGVSPGLSKANDDYQKRTDKTDEKIRADNTLVLLNLHAWNSQKPTIVDWLAEKNAEKKWKEVRCIDGAQLVDWLELHPAVAARYARDVLKRAPQDGAISTDEYWDQFSLRFSPPLVEAVLLCDRGEQSKELLGKLAGPAQTFMIAADSSNEVVAFAVAAIRSAPPAERRFLESRTLIIENEKAARFLSTKENLSFITTGGGDKWAGVLGKAGPTLSAATGVQARKHVALVRPSASAMAEALATMNMSREEGYELAHRCGRSIAILNRLIHNGPFENPEWVAGIDVLKPAFLAGGWSTKSDLDKQVLKELSASPDYSSFESSLLPTLTLTDPPMDRVEDVWKVRAPVDAFMFYGHLVGEADLERLRQAAIKVLGHKAKEPSREEKFSFNYVAPADYSEWLREGLALTLLIFAALPKDGGLIVPGKTAQTYVNEIVSALPGFGKEYEALAAISGQLGILAEAAPAPFLSALESMLEGDPNEIGKIFSESDDIFSSTSLHVYVLHSLELLAWDPTYLERSALILARLASIDPGGKLSNRPINSLRTIFLSWAPNTYALLPQRIACLDSVLARYPQVAWTLLESLLPRSHDTSSATSKPKLRDVSPIVEEEITFGLVWDTNAQIVSRALQYAGDSDIRLLKLIEHLASFDRESRTKSLVTIDRFLERNTSPVGHSVWHALNHEVTRHRFFAATDWSMKEDELTEFDAVVRKHEPVDPVAKIRPLFDDWMPHIGVMSDLSDKETESARVTSLRSVLETLGPSGIVSLYKQSKIPSLIAEPLAKLALPLDTLSQLMMMCVKEQPLLMDFAIQISAIGRMQFGEAWESLTLGVLDEIGDSPKLRAQIFLGWPIERKTWAYVESLGDGSIDEYWAQVNSLPREESIECLIFAVDKFRAGGRSLDVICLLYQQTEKLPSSLLISLLEEAYQAIGGGDRKFGNMLSYYLAEIFKVLREKQEASLNDLARLEYAYLPLLRHEKMPLTLHKLMSEDPKFFVEVLSHVFRKNGSDANDVPSEKSDEARGRAITSYELLSSFELIPGASEEGIDQKILGRWVDGVRAAAKEADLVEIGDQYVGKLLAHSVIAASDIFWPPVAVAALLEDVKSSSIERGIAIERINMRGVYGKALYEGGKQERELATRYQNWANSALKFPRTAAMLHAISTDWLSQAKHEDIRAEKDKLGR